MTTTDRPTMPPITCQPWCSDGEGHADARYAEDQVSFSDALTSEFAGVYPADMSSKGSPSWEVSAAHRPAERRHPFIVMTVDGSLPEYQMTPMQARVLAAHLTLVADQIDKGRATSALASMPTPQTVGDLVAAAAEIGVRASDVVAAISEGSGPSARPLA